MGKRRLSGAIAASLVSFLALVACSAPTDTPVVEGAGADAAAPPPNTTPNATPSPAATPKEKKGKPLYLTLDDGPTPPYTNQILDILAENDAKATFFILGYLVKEFPAEFKRIRKEGHAIGNHTWNHPQLPKLSAASVRDQFNWSRAAIGKSMGKCMRPPYGMSNATVDRIAAEMGYKKIMWTTHVADWNNPPVATMVKQLKAATKPRVNLLLHDGGGHRANTVAALRIMIPWWKERGYDLRPLPACAKRFAQP